MPRELHHQAANRYSIYLSSACFAPIFFSGSSLSSGRRLTSTARWWWSSVAVALSPRAFQESIHATSSGRQCSRKSPRPSSPHSEVSGVHLQNQIWYLNNEFKFTNWERFSLTFPLPHQDVAEEVYRDTVGRRQVVAAFNAQELGDGVLRLEFRTELVDGDWVLLSLFISVLK